MRHHRAGQATVCVHAEGSQQLHLCQPQPTHVLGKGECTLGGYGFYTGTSVFFFDKPMPVTAAGKRWREGPGQTNGVPAPASGGRRSVGGTKSLITWDAVHVGAAVLDTGAASAAVLYCISAGYLSVCRPCQPLYPS